MLPSVHNTTDRHTRPAAAFVATRSSGFHKIKSNTFYEEYHGHRIDHLSKVHESLKTNPERVCCFLVGDSSMDNKYCYMEKKPRPSTDMKIF